VNFHHVPVLAEAVRTALRPERGDTVVDLTLGGAGHACLLAAGLGPGGLLVAADRDGDALIAGQQRLHAMVTELASDAPRVHVQKGSFDRLGALLTQAGVGLGTVSVILADLGVSSHHLDVPERGFSFAQDGPLDMRMDRTQPMRAWDYVNDLPQDALTDILFQLGGETDARRVAKAICLRRAERPFRTTLDLADVVARAKGGRRGARIHPATLVFQALRVHVNREGAQLLALLDQALPWLRPGGRLGVISFHSGEDRVVKERFAAWAKGCSCPPELPICSCGGRSIVALPFRKGLVADEAELASNPRSRSARLRVAVRLPSESPA
jgi:16S rRNA (cytosine1402-N4)-methyltransferase